MIYETIENINQLIVPVDYENRPTDWKSHGSSGFFSLCEHGCDYTIMAAFESGEDGPATGDALLRINGTWGANDTTTVIFDGWVNDATHKIVIWSEGEGKHKGNWTNGSYALVPSATRGIASKEAYLWLTGFMIKPPSGGGNPGIWLLEEGMDHGNISNIILDGNGNIAIVLDGIQNPDTDEFTYIYNNVIFDCGTRCIHVNEANIDAAYIYSNTMHTTDSVGLYTQAGITVAKNNIVEGADNFDYLGTFAGGSDYNVASDTTTTGGSNDIVSTQCVFINEAGWNLHLDPSDTACQNNGTDLSSDVNLSFNTDVDYESRTGTWDRGADEIPAPAGVTCKYLGGDWNETCSNNCIITESIVLNESGNISLQGSGTFTIRANISNFSQITNDCHIIVDYIHGGGLYGR